MNAQEFAEIAEKHSKFVFNVAYKIMGNAHDAEEAAQDAFVSAHKARDKFRGDAQPTTWLYRIAVNAALMRIRKDKRGKEMTVSVDERPEIELCRWDELPHAAAMNNELRTRIDEAIVGLPENYRIAVVLRDVQGLSNQEAAGILDVSVTALKSRLHHGRIAMRDHLQNYVKETVL